MHQYWFEFADPAIRGRLYGVTAYDLADARCILSAEVFDGGEVPEPSTLVEDIAFAALDENHVVPNMGLFVARGVWYPQGFRQPYPQ